MLQGCKSEFEEGRRIVLCEDLFTIGVLYFQDVSVKPLPYWVVNSVFGP